MKHVVSALVFIAILFAAGCGSASVPKGVVGRFCGNDADVCSWCLHDKLISSGCGTTGYCGDKVISTVDCSKSFKELYGTHAKGKCENLGYKVQCTETSGVAESFGDTAK